MWRFQCCWRYTRYSQWWIPVLQPGHAGVQPHNLIVTTNEFSLSFTLQHKHESTVLSLQPSSNLPTSLPWHTRSYETLWHISHTMHKVDSTQEIRAFWWLIPEVAVIIQTERKSLLAKSIPNAKGISKKLECIGNHNNIKTTFKTKHTLRSSPMRTRQERDQKQTAHCFYIIPH
jgi:hypothetical protein